jgi:hypothetical protein
MARLASLERASEREEAQLGLSVAARTQSTNVPMEVLTSEEKDDIGYEGSVASSFRVLDAAAEESSSSHSSIGRHPSIRGQRDPPQHRAMASSIDATPVAHNHAMASSNLYGKAQPNRAAGIVNTSQQIFLSSTQAPLQAKNRTNHGSAPVSAATSSRPSSQASFQSQSGSQLHTKSQTKAQSQLHSQPHSSSHVSPHSSFQTRAMTSQFPVMTQ